MSLPFHPGYLDTLPVTATNAFLRSMTDQIQAFCLETPSTRKIVTTPLLFSQVCYSGDLLHSQFEFDC
ncbi:hypothetical protein CY34DRAFT_814383 [Suillus luteus UH-Slu-Lm8-n1]|uniref:Uncharacterized protein n=1 Tax=Suillus luteus UH-Slu-Lm8-n1 TaxID=930992 RepID=A0A0C9ZSG3_9AGAM|nr:hypothetical protein CY34DRAFT_814383 [Suillus luteus UH-Slu-Lm8-n1]